MTRSLAPAKFKLMVDPQDPVGQVVGMRFDTERAMGQNETFHWFVKFAIRIEPSDLW